MVQETPSQYVHFPERSELLAKLRLLQGYGPELDPLYRLIAERLAEKAYDRSAFVFILIELVYEFEAASGGNWSELLSRVVVGLTDDEELAASALEAYGEIKASLEPEEPPEPPAFKYVEPEALAPSPAETSEQPLGPFIARHRTPDQERLMVSLQQAQKKIADLGLSTRMSIDMTLSRPGRDTVNHTLREVATLRYALRQFAGLLDESEGRILEVIGVLERDEI